MNPAPQTLIGYLCAPADRPDGATVIQAPFAYDAAREYARTHMRGKFPELVTVRVVFRDLSRNFKVMTDGTWAGLAPAKRRR